MSYLTFDQIVETAAHNLSHMDAASLKVMYQDEKSLGVLHHGYGTHLRNTYKLWEKENPLTAQWFKDCDEAPDRQHEFMDNGVDCHPQHPDQVSMDLIVGIWKYCKKNYPD